MDCTDFVSLIDENTTIKVSSTLEKTTGKKNLVDNNPETCWTSQQGLPQFIQLTFNTKVLPKRLSITFQGGFVGTTCALQFPTEAKEWKIFTNIYPQDVNRKQNFDLKPIEPEQLETGHSALKIVFDTSSDFFGRITIYDLKLEGILLSE